MLGRLRPTSRIRRPMVRFPQSAGCLPVRELWLYVFLITILDILLMSIVYDAGIRRQCPRTDNS